MNEPLFLVIDFITNLFKFSWLIVWLSHSAALITPLMFRFLFFVCVCIRFECEWLTIWNCIDKRLKKKKQDMTDGDKRNSVRFHALWYSTVNDTNNIREMYFCVWNESENESQFVPVRCFFCFDWIFRVAINKLFCYENRRMQLIDTSWILSVYELRTMTSWH